MDSSRLLKRIIPVFRTKKTGPSKDLNRLQEQDESLDTFLSNVPTFTQDVEVIARDSELRHAQEEEERYQAIIRKSQKKRPSTRKRTAYEREMVSEGNDSEYIHPEREKKVPGKDQFEHRRKTMAYVNLEEIKRREAAKDALEEEKIHKAMAKREFAQKLLDKQEKEKKVKMQKSLTAAWDGQVEYKQQKMGMDKIRKQGSYSLTKSERLHRMEDCKKNVYDNLDNIKKKEAASYIVLEEKRCKERAKQQLGQQIREEQERKKKADLKKSLADTWDAQIQDKQQKKKEKAEIERQQMAAIMESDRRHQIEEIEMRRRKTETYRKCMEMEMYGTERQAVLPGYRAEEVGARRQKKEAQQILKTQDKISEQRRAVPYKSVVQDHDIDCNVPVKDRIREIRKKIVYDQMSLKKKEEDTKRTLMEDKLMKDIKHREAAEIKREKLEKDKKAAATKSMTDSWDSQIQRKQQEKKKLCDFERKDMLSLIELDRVCGGENNKRIQLDIKQPIYHEVWTTLPAAEPGRSSSKSCVETADKHDAKPSSAYRPLLSRQKVISTKPVKLPSLNSNSAHLPENCQHKNVKLPSIPRPK